MSKSGETKTKRKKVIGVGKKDGRPRKEIDKETFEQLCSLQCTLVEICSWFDIDDMTLNSWCKRTYENKTFSEVFKLKRSKGLISLRRSQFKMAQNVPSLSIWLGKQYLGQKDQESFMATERETIPEFDKMSDADLDKYIKETK